MLDAGDPPRTLETLRKRAKELRVEAKRNKPSMLIQSEIRIEHVIE
jgi:hypothetical protein